MTPTASRPGAGDAGPVDIALIWERDASQCTCRLCHRKPAEFRSRATSKSPLLRYMAGRVDVLGGTWEVAA